ncbi:hypothetical protein [Xenorhabdus hominickii]|uniref:hypothetical protein n=1 Tax=Xenorhabdus hominickii TaxID=351679 RepID=UPI0012EE51FD|nr:hypothetical protein [Xenorhabdus hominickii]
MINRQDITMLLQTQKSNQWCSTVVELATRIRLRSEQTKALFRQQLIKTAGVLKP